MINLSIDHNLSISVICMLKIRFDMQKIKKVTCIRLPLSVLANLQSVNLRFSSAVVKLFIILQIKEQEKTTTVFISHIQQHFVHVTPSVKI